MRDIALSRFFLLLMLSMCCGVFCPAQVFASTAHTGMRGWTALQMVKDMQVGWNLGNTLDATGGETGWGNPKTTKAMIDKIKEAGFRTIRIPVTWHEHIGAGPDYVIEKAWLDRVEEVANYAFENDMYVIINLHHEDAVWVKPWYANQEKTIEELTKVWEQIATRFKDYGDYLILETLNEPRPVGAADEWMGGSKENREVINKFNAAAVKAIRSTGGNNTTRFIMSPTVAASSMSVAVDDWVAPADDPHVILSVHMYSPYSFAMDEKGTTEWGSAADKAATDAELEALYQKFVKKGRAVVIGEFGSAGKNNQPDRARHAEYFVQAARKRGMTPVWWDNGVYIAGRANKNNYGIFNRKTLAWDCPEIMQAIIKGARVTPNP